MNTQIQSNAIRGQGANLPDLKPRDQEFKKAKDPNEISELSIRENPALYGRFISPSDIEASRTIFIMTQSEAPDVLISTQLNNRIDVVPDNQLIKGGTRQSF